MRGDPLHNFMAPEVQGIADRFCDFTSLECRFRKNGVTTFFDVFARRGAISLAFEIETTSRHAVDNAQKACAVGVPMWIVVPRRRLRRKLFRQLDSLELRPGNEPIKILLLGQVEQELTNYLSLFIPANRERGKE